ncbi:MAG: purine-binding chemotaxis protein CheW [Lachnospiraceae bacterium]|nr:purine-binding chemotaxis protein CheW [Lachnospiraceae bacterium]
MTEFKPVVFKVGNEYYGVDINLVRGIEKMIQVVSIPNSNPNIKGIINLRGDVIPVYSLRKKFNLEMLNESEENQFIIVKVEDMLLALEVDKVDEIQNISEDMIFDVPIIIKSKETKYAEKIISGNGRIVIIIDIHNLMSDMEMQELTEMVQDMA